jgi:ureidoglycolate lyase
VILTPEPLTSAAFAPFGDVIACDPAKAFDINDGFTTRHHALAAVQTDDRAILSIFEGRVRPLCVAMLERHPDGSQAFMPLGGQNWLVVVAEEPVASACCLFWCSGDQGVNYRAGVWHHPLLVIESPQRFLVVDRQGKGANLDEVFFDTPLEIDLTQSKSD